MAESSKEWNQFQMALEAWRDAIVKLERATVAERELRWKIYDAARNLEEKG